MKQEITLEEYKRIYNRTIKKFDKKEFIEDLKMTAMSSIMVIAVLSFLEGKIDAFSIVNIFVAMFAILGVPSLIRNHYHYKIENEFTNIETLKKAYRKSRKNIAKRNFLIILGIYTLLLVIFAIYNFLLHAFTYGAIQGYIFLLVVFGILSLIEFTKYKENISEERFKKIDAKVGDEIRIVKEC